jgi:hypothetical protein
MSSDRRDVVLFTDWTLVRVFPPLRAAWGARRQRGHGADHRREREGGCCSARSVSAFAHGVVVARPRATGANARAFLRELRGQYRGWGTMWLLADHAMAHRRQP